MKNFSVMISIGFTKKFQTFYGKYDINIRKELENLQIINQKFFFNILKLFGAIQVRILAPKKLFVSFLFFKLENGRNVLSICN